MLMLFMLLLVMATIATGRKGRKKREDGHYYLKCMGKTRNHKNCKAHGVLTGSNEAYRWPQLKPHTCTIAGDVQYTTTTFNRCGPTPFLKGKCDNNSDRFVVLVVGIKPPPNGGSNHPQPPFSPFLTTVVVLCHLGVVFYPPLLGGWVYPHKGVDGNDGKNLCGV